MTNSDNSGQCIVGLPTPTGRIWIMTGAILAGLAVVTGAFGAHGLENWLTETYEDPVKRLANWETAARYQMYHSIAIIFVGLLWNERTIKLSYLCAISLLAGIVLFSGCLYSWVLMDTTAAPVPIGGFAFIIGWVSIATLAIMPRSAPASNEHGGSIT